MQIQMRSSLAAITMVVAFIASFTDKAPAQTCSAWARATFDGRNSHQAVYDAARGEVVTFGGSLAVPSTGSTLPTRAAETWTWDSIAWTRASIGGPAARSGYAMAYDSIRQRVVLFGGTDGSAFFGDTWEWDGTSWEQIASSGPPPRTDAAMTFDSARGVCVLFGGGTNTARYGGTWEWNGKTWNLRSETGPPSRLRHAIAFDAARGVCVLCGGTSNIGPSGITTQFQDTWEWNGDVWTPKGDSSPANRYWHQLAFDADLGRVIMYGGLSTGNVLGGVTFWDGSTWQLRSVPSTPSTPINRYGHAMAFDTDREVLVLIGGVTSNFSGNNVASDTWELASTGPWQLRSASSVPPPRSDFAMAFDPVREIALIYGSSSASMRETWQWNAATELWSQITTPDAPGNAAGYTMVFDSARGLFVLVGGGREETWEYTPETRWVNRKVVSPPARADPAVAFDPVRQVIVMFGGTSSTNSVLGDTWEYNGTAWTQRAISGPTPRQDSAMAFDPKSNRVILFGGNASSSSSESPQNDTWAWNGSFWTPINTPTKPTRRLGHAMILNSQTSELYMLGGSTNVSATDMTDPYRWDGNDWKLNVIQRPITPRFDFGSFFNSRTGRLHVFAGNIVTGSFSGSVTSEMWELLVNQAPDFSLQPTTLELNSGSAFTLSVPETGTAPVSYQWSRDGVELTDDVNTTGSTTRTLELIGVTPEHSGEYSVVASNSCGQASAVIANVTIRCPGDANNDNTCNGQDLSVLLSSFGNSVPAGTGADFNASGAVTGADISVLLSRFGQGCGDK